MAEQQAAEVGSKFWIWVGRFVLILQLFHYLLVILPLLGPASLPFLVPIIIQFYPLWIVN